MKIRFANGEELNYIRAVETEEYYNGNNRRTLTFECEKGSIDLEALNVLLSNEGNVSDIVLINTAERDEVRNTYSGYVLKLSCGIESRMIEAETSESPAKYSDVIIFKLGKRTFTEVALYKMGLM